jgi:hypothetical protein
MVEGALGATWARWTFTMRLEARSSLAVYIPYLPSLTVSQPRKGAPGFWAGRR